MDDEFRSEKVLSPSEKKIYKIKDSKNKEKIKEKDDKNVNDTTFDLKPKVKKRSKSAVIITKNKLETSADKVLERPKTSKKQNKFLAEDEDSLETLVGKYGPKKQPTKVKLAAKVDANGIKNENTIDYKSLRLNLNARKSKSVERKPTSYLFRTEDPSLDIANIKKKTIIKKKNFRPKSVKLNSTLNDTSEKSNASLTPKFESTDISHSSSKISKPKSRERARSLIKIYRPASKTKIVHKIEKQVKKKIINKRRSNSISTLENSLDDDTLTENNNNKVNEKKSSLKSSATVSNESLRLVQSDKIKKKEKKVSISENSSDRSSDSKISSVKYTKSRAKSKFEIPDSNAKQNNFKFPVFYNNTNINNSIDALYTNLLRGETVQNNHQDHRFFRTLKKDIDSYLRQFSRSHQFDLTHKEFFHDNYYRNQNYQNLHINNNVPKKRYVEEEKIVPVISTLYTSPRTPQNTVRVSKTYNNFQIENKSDNNKFLPNEAFFYKRK